MKRVGFFRCATHSLTRSRTIDCRDRLSLSLSRSLSLSLSPCPCCSSSVQGAHTLRLLPLRTLRSVACRAKPWRTPHAM